MPLIVDQNLMAPAEFRLQVQKAPLLMFPCKTGHLQGPFWMKLLLQQIVCILHGTYIPHFIVASQKLKQKWLPSVNQSSTPTFFGNLFVCSIDLGMQEEN